MTKIAIVILNWNGKENTLACLRSISRLQSTDYSLQTIVIDNASSDESVESIKYYVSGIKGSKIELIVNNKNLGYAGGNNVGIRYAIDVEAEYVLILNNDTLVDRNLIEELLKVAKTDEKIGIVAPKIYFAPGFEFHRDRYKKNELGKVIWYAGGTMDWANVIGSHRGVDEVDQGQYNKIEKTDFASGCCLLLKAELIKKVGMFDEKYFLYYEDSDLSERAKKAGFDIVYAPKAVLWHKNAGSAGGSGSTLQDYYITRNRLLFGMRYAPIRAKIALFRESIGLLTSGREWQKKGVADFYGGRFGKGNYVP